MSQPDRAFRFRLAGHLGMTVAELGRRMSYRELLEWRIYDQSEPIGAVRSDLMIAQLCSLFYNANRGRHSPRKRVKDFMPFPRKPISQGMDEDELAQNLRMFAMANGAADGKHRNHRGPDRSPHG